MHKRRSRVSVVLLEVYPRSQFPNGTNESSPYDLVNYRSSEDRRYKCIITIPVFQID